MKRVSYRNHGYSLLKMPKVAFTRTFLPQIYSVCMETPCISCSWGKECEPKADIFLIVLQPRVGTLWSRREVHVWLFVFCFLWQRNSHLNRCAPFKPPPSLWVSSSQSLQCPDVIQCMHKLCYCLTESRGWGLQYLVAATYLCRPVSRKGRRPAFITWI